MTQCEPIVNVALAVSLQGKYMADNETGYTRALRGLAAVTSCGKEEGILACRYLLRGISCSCLINSGSDLICKKNA